MLYCGSYMSYFAEKCCIYLPYMLIESCIRLLINVVLTYKCRIVELYMYLNIFNLTRVCFSI